MGYDGSDGPPRNDVPEPLPGVALCDLPADAADVSAYARQGDQIRQVLQALFRISLARTSLEVQLEQVVAYISSLSWLALEAKGAVFLTDPAESNVLVLKAHRNMSQGLVTLCARVPFGRCLCGRAAATGEVVFAPHIDDRHENRPPGMTPHGHYCVPIVLRGRVLGVITLYVKDSHCQDGREEEFLSTVADALAGILEHRGVQEELVQTADRLKRALESITRALSLAVEIRDPYTAGHQRRVADLARAIAQEMGLREEQTEATYLAARIHDVGKIAIPSDILCKPGTIRRAEFELIKDHSQLGYELLTQVELHGLIATIVLQHHERLDGSGYPSGLKGNDILVEARVLAVADVVEAMFHHRPYRAALGVEVTLAEIEKNRGRLYDPGAVDACLRLFRQKHFGWD